MVVRGSFVFVQERRADLPLGGGASSIALWNSSRLPPVRSAIRNMMRFIVRC